MNRPFANRVEKCDISKRIRADGTAEDAPYEMKLILPYLTGALPDLRLRLAARIRETRLAGAPQRPFRLLIANFSHKKLQPP